MTSRDVTAGRLETARHCLETLCNDCYLKVYHILFNFGSKFITCVEKYLHYVYMVLAVNNHVNIIYIHYLSNTNANANGNTMTMLRAYDNNNYDNACYSNR